MKRQTVTLKTLKAKVCYLSKENERNLSKKETTGKFRATKGEHQTTEEEINKRCQLPHVVHFNITRFECLSKAQK